MHSRVGLESQSDYAGLDTVVEHFSGERGNPSPPYSKQHASFILVHSGSGADVVLLPAALRLSAACPLERHPRDVTVAAQYAQLAEEDDSPASPC